MVQERSPVPVDWYVRRPTYPSRRHSDDPLGATRWSLVLATGRALDMLHGDGRSVRLTDPWW